MYSILLFIHILSFLGWGGFSTGAYIFIKLTSELSGKIVFSYYKITLIQIISFIILSISGFILLSMLNYPKWGLIGILFGFPLALFEVINFIQVRRSLNKGVEHLLKFTDRFSPLWTTFFLVELYIMVFKPVP